jgi:hypothetical protein
MGLGSEIFFHFRLDSIFSFPHSGRRMIELVLQGRAITARDRATIQGLIATHRQWSRRRLSRELCLQWNWRNAAGQIKDLAARSLLVKLQARGLIRLPERRPAPGNRRRSQPIEARDWDQTPIQSALPALGAVEVEEISSQIQKRGIFAAALAQFHYLGFRATVGENLQYLMADDQGRLLACLLFGSPAWKCRPRDQWIGWNQEQRQKNLYLTTNNTRFLILPWVKAPGLASWILDRVSRRLSGDWQKKYGHPILLMETFVERDRFQGTAYRAANWIKVGSTTGRTRQDRERKIKAPVKDVYLHPFQKNFPEELCR